MLAKGEPVEVRITTLTENTASYGFIGEWGLSILVEAEGPKMLFDTGMSFSAVHNARLSRVDLSTVDRIVLSHGHVDHTGGLGEVLKRTGGVPVFGHPDIWAEKYSLRGQEGMRYVGMPFSRGELESLGARFELSSKPVEIADRVMTSGEVPMVFGHESVDGNLLVKHGGSMLPDPLADDLAVIIKADFGLVVILGCAHRGVVNTLRHAQKLTGREQVYAVIGGTHLMRASPERVESTIAELKQMGVQRLGLSHCTGFPASARLAQEFGDAFFHNQAGTSVTLP